MDQHLKEEVAELYARFCSGLADTNRILILYILSEHSCNVGEIAEKLCLPQPTVSRHLKILRERGIVLAERAGQSVFYTLSDHRIIDALNLLRSVIADRLETQSTLAQQVQASLK
ncbi:MAG: metalloregulator ArsR/SmtB family transcription factor [Aggregatilineales bacterium]